MYQIKITTADKKFSWFIRLRDRKCVRCGSHVKFNDKGLPVSHTNSHYWSRGNWNTRFDQNNCDCLCISCHHAWGGDYRREYEAFKRKQLGEKRYKQLELAAHTTGKKDWKLALIVVNDMLEKQSATL